MTVSRPARDARSSVGELPLVAVFVGTDHHRFDRLVTWVSSLASEGWARWFVQHGTTPWSPTSGLPVHGTAYVDQSALDEVLRHAGAVVTHGGPGMIMDALLAGHTPVAVARDPRLREHVDDHQMRFVDRLAGEEQVRTGRDLPDLRRSVRSELAAGPAERPAHDSASTISARFGDLVVTVRDRHRPRVR